MLRARPQDWAAQPFSFKKVCRVVEIWFGLLSLGLLAWRFLETGREGWWLLAIWAVLNFTFQRFLEIVVWRSLPGSFREDIAYDAAEATSGKGTIRSYRDLIRWFREPRPTTR